MEVVSNGPLPVASLVWQARPTIWVLTVVCKATFTLGPGELSLAPMQEPIRERDAHREDDGARSLIEASDLVPFKQGADVVLVGSAYAPGGRPTQSLVARMIIGEINKPIHVMGDRQFTADGELQEGASFTRMSLAYERAAGGPDTANPAGVRRARNADGSTALPNLLPLDLVVASGADVIPPVGLGPIAPGWPMRKRKLGQHTAAWSSGTLLSSPLPEDFDRSFFNVAPDDQRVVELHDDERIVLENLHPRFPGLVANLPGLRPRATVTGRPVGPRELAMRADTLAIDTNRLLCSVTWRGQVPLVTRDEGVNVRIELDPPTSDMPHSPHLAHSKPSHPWSGTLEISTSAATTDIPFVGKGSVPPAPPPPIAHSAPPIVNGGPESRVSPWAARGAATPGATLMGVTPNVPVPAPAQNVGIQPVATVAALAAPAAMAHTHATHKAMALVWFDRKSVRRIVRKPAWQRILDSLEDEPVDPEADDPALSDEPAEIEDRAQVFEILDRGAPTGIDGVHAALARAGGKRRMPVPPLELVEGELTLSFDSVEMLKALVSTATPFAPGDDTLANAITTAEKFLATAGVSSAPAVAEALCARIREALAQGKKGRAELANEQVQRALLEQRHYEKRKVLGGSHLRALLLVQGETQPLVTYLPASIAEDLPLAQRFSARVIAAVHPAVDEREVEPVALQAAALGRVVQIGRAR
ncbi:MAG: DUF2169 domain-containing protein [Polyangiaceae bacterium]|nr:DUF2169 domain-containing protein [Polyangiaceae bacterium]